MKRFVILLFVSFCLASCENENIISEKTLIIASQKADCVGIAPQKCLLIKEKESENWQYFYSNIVGFEYEEGFEYEITVSEREIKDPPQDGSSIETKLIQIISKIEKTSENLPF